jgi:hypothetical protein
MSLGWQPHAPALVIAAIAVGIAAWAWWARRELAPRWGGRSWALVAPKLAALALLALALLDPSLERAGEGAKRTLLVLIDQSSSMDVRDGPHGESRRERAERLADSVSAPSGVTVAKRWFDTALHEQAETGAEERGTDLAACLQLAARVTGECAGVVVISDGGDEPAPEAAVPSLPISAIGVGADAGGRPNLAIADLQAPSTAERNLDLTLTVDAAAGGPADFLSRLGAVPLVLERQDGDAWKQVQAATVDLTHGRGRIAFTVKPDRVGPARFRVALAEQPGELSTLDNRRTALVDVRERALHVLYFTRSLGLDFKPLRAELARDPGISFTALYRTVGARLGGAERFTVQGDRAGGDDQLEAGFPGTAQALARFDCVILGSFPASGLGEAQARALAEYVQNGGSAVFLGGEESFGLGGYAGSPLAPLMPWQLQDTEAALTRGDITVTLPPEASGHAITQGLLERLGAGATVASVNHPGALRGGAVALLQANAGGETVALAAAQVYGKGKVLGIATDTLWRIGREGRAGDSAFGVFWRQAVRWLADRGEGGQVLRVTWDKPAYRPGETARATVRLAVGGGTCRLAASIDHAGARSDLAPAAAAASDGEAWTVSAPFPGRGEYAVRIVAYRDGATLETYEKPFSVAPLLPEGARLARDDEGLARLAEAHGGVYVREEDPAALAPWLAATARSQRPVQATSLVFASPWWLGALTAALLIEWIIRRRRNLI